MKFSMTARRATFGLLASTLFVSGAAAQTAPEIDSLDVAAPERILFVGNSYLYYGDSLHNHVVRMAQEAYPDGDFSYKSATISGAYLVQHNIESLVEPGRLGLDEPFDVVVLQGHSTAMTTDEKRGNFSAAVEAALEPIRSTGAQVALYMTPAYTEVHGSFDPGMFDKIDAGYTEVGNAVDAMVIPVGLAFEIAYERRPDIELHKAFDGSHPTMLGTYLAAATTFAALYDESVVGNPYTYFGAVGDADARFLQEVAEEAVETYYGRTS